MKHLKIFEEYYNNELRKEYDYGNVSASIKNDLYEVADIINRYGDSEIILTVLNEEYSNELFPVSILENINIKESYRNIGNGKKLYYEYENWAKINNCQYSLLVSDKEEKQLDDFNLDNWYKSLGYVKIGNISNNSVMIKDLI